MSKDPETGYDDENYDYSDYNDEDYMRIEDYLDQHPQDDWFLNEIADYEGDLEYNERIVNDLLNAVEAYLGSFGTFKSLIKLIVEHYGS